MVSKNNHKIQLEEVADRQPHFGIRKLTVGVASVLLGTTLWLSGTTSSVHAETVNTNNNDADKATDESDTKTPSIDSNTKVIVQTNNDVSTEQKVETNTNKGLEADSKSSAVQSTIKEAPKSGSTSQTTGRSAQSVLKGSSQNTESVNKATTNVNNTSSAQQVKKSAEQKANADAQLDKKISSSVEQAGQTGKTTVKTTQELKINDLSTDLSGDALKANLGERSDLLVSHAGLTGRVEAGKNADPTQQLAALKTSLVATPNASDSYTTVTDISGLQSAIDNSSVSGVSIKGTIVANGDLNINRAFTIKGADKTATLNLGSNKINNNGTLTLDDITVNGAVVGNGAVNIKGTVTSTVGESDSLITGNSASEAQKALWAQTGQNNNMGATIPRKGNNWVVSGWNYANFTTSNLTVDDNASLTINRSAVGDGILLNNNGSVNVSDNGALTINMNTQNDLNTMARYHNAGVFSYNGGSFNTGHDAVVTMNTSIGQAIALGAGRPYTNDDDRFGGYGEDNNTRKDGPSTVALGRSSKFTFSGRDGVILGNNSTFNSGEYSTVRFNNKGRGVALDLGNNSNIIIAKHSDTLFNSVGKSHIDAKGKTVSPSGSYSGYNYIGVNENGNITVDDYATFRVVLTGRNGGSSVGDEWDDVVQLDTRKSTGKAAFTANKGSVVDIRDDNNNYYAELISFPRSPKGANISTTFNDALYINLSRYSANPVGQNEGWMPTPLSGSNITKTDKYTSNLIYMGYPDGSGPLKISGTDKNGNPVKYAVYQQNKQDGTQTLWLNVNGIDYTIAGFANTSTYDNGSNPDISISGTDLKGGVRANDIDDRSVAVNGHYGISSQRSAHQIWFPHETTTDVTGTHRNIVKYVYEDGTPVTDANGDPLVKTQKINLDRNLTLDINEDSIKDIQNYAQTHNADEVLAYLKNSYRVTQDSGWKYTDDNGNTVSNPYSEVDYQVKDGYTATVQSTNAPGVVVGSDGSKVKANFALDASKDVVQNGQLSNDYKTKGVTGIPEDYETVVVIKKATQAAITVNYKDVDNNNAILHTDNPSGNIGDTIGYTTKSEINTLEGQGYELVSDGYTNVAGTTYTKDNNGKTYDVLLKHATRTVDPKHPVDPKNPVDPDHPDNPSNKKTIPGLTADDLQKTVTRTINYVDDTNAHNPVAKSVTSKVVFTGTGTIDKVTGKLVTLNNDGSIKDQNGKITWTYSVDGGASQSGSTYSFPVTGAKSTVTNNGKTYNFKDVEDSTYKPDTTYDGGNGAVKVYTVDASKNPTDLVVNVVYHENAVPTPTEENGKISVIFHDTTTDKDIPNHGFGTPDDPKSGKTGDPTDYTPDKDITDLENQGYVPDGDIPTVPTKYPDSKNPVNVVINMKHGIAPVGPKTPGKPGTPINPNDPNGPKWPAGSDKVIAEVTRTVKYIDQDGKPVNGSPNGKDIEIQTVTFTREGYVDKTTGNWVNVKTDSNGKPVTDDNGNYEVDPSTTASTPTWKATNGNSNFAKLISKTTVGDLEVKQVLPSDQADGKDVKQETVTPDSDSPTVYVIYGPKSKETGSINIIYHDTTTNENISGHDPATPLTGESGSDVNTNGYSIDDEVTKLEQQGYERDTTTPIPSGDLSSIPAKYTNGTQTVWINLKHSYSPVDPKHPDKRVDPSEYTKNVKETVHYVGAGDKTPKDNVQNATWTRTLTIDKVTGQVVLKGQYDTDWTPDKKTYDVVPTPRVDGYTPDQDQIPQETVTQQDINKVVVYSPNAKPAPGNQAAQVIIYDDTAKTRLNALDAQGKDGTTITFQGDRGAVDSYLNNGYVFEKALTGDEKNPGTTSIGTISKDAYNISYGNYDSDDKTTQSFTIYLVHGQKPATPDNPNGVDPSELTQKGTATVHYVVNGNDPDKPLAPSDNTQTITWTRTLTVDAVTGQVVPKGNYDKEWTPSKENYDTVNTPRIPGYYADKGSVTFEKPQRGDKLKETVTYNPNGKIIPYIPSKDNPDDPTKGTPIPGVDNPKFPTDPKDPTKTTNGKVPTVPSDYTPSNPNEKPGDSIKPDPQNPGKDVYVPFTPKNPVAVDDQNATLTVIDQTTNSTLKNYNDLDQKHGTNISFTGAQTDISNWLNSGYELVSTDKGTTTDANLAGNDPSKWTFGTFDNDNNTVQKFVVTLKHKTTTFDPDKPNPIDPKNPDQPKPGDKINPNDPDPNGPKVNNDMLDYKKQVTATVHYVVSDGKTKAPDDNVQKATWKRTITVDNVTGNIISSTPWTTSDKYGDVNTPRLDGYYADKGVVKAPKVTQSNAYTQVTYYPNGKIIPVIPDPKNPNDPSKGTPIPGVDNPKFPTDPTDPTKTTNGKVPTVPSDYTPSNPNEKPGSSISPDPQNPGKDVYVPFTPKTPTPTPENETVTVKYYDDTDKSNDLSSYNKTISGTAGSDLNYTTQPSITDLENKGYKLVSDSFTTANLGGKMPANGGNYEVHVAHKTVTVTPNKPGKPGEPVDPNNPNGPKYPSGTDINNLQKQGTMTVNYVIEGNDPNKPQAPESQTRNVTFQKQITFDEVTGKVINDSGWNINEQTYPMVNSPEVKGYTPDEKAVGGKTVKVTDNDMNVTYTVHYTKNGSPVDNTQRAKVVYQDVNDPTHIAVLHTDDSTSVAGLSGQPGDKIVYSTSDEINTLIKKGYVLKNDGFPTDAAFDNDNSTDQTFYVEFTHGTTTVTPDKPGKPGEPVDPNNPDGPKYPDGTDEKSVKVTGTQTIHYTGAGDKTPGDNTQSYDFTRNITFDNVTGKIINTAPWNETSHTFGNVDTPVVDGYHADKRNAGGTTITPEDLTKTVTVTYSPNGKIIPVDPKTNKPIPNAPTPQYPTDPNDPTKVTPNEPVPNVPGLTPSVPSVTPKDPGKDTPVPYNPETPAKNQNAVVNYVDADNNNSQIATSGPLSGKSGAKIDYSTATTITDLTNKGYVLVNDGFPKDATFDNDDNTTQTYTVVFKHGTVPVNPTNPGKPGEPINPNDPNGPKYPDGTGETDLDKNVTRTITFVDNNGKEVASPVDQTVHFTATGVLDKVTGKWVTPLTWSPDQSIDGKNVPFVDGYHVVSIDKDGNGLTNVKGVTLTHNDSSYKVTVTYSPNGKIIPIDPSGKPIPNAPTPTYPTDPKDPSKVTPNESVPTVPGRTPDQSTVTPKDPGKDTPVIYRQAEDQIAQVIYRDINDPSKAVQIGTSGNLSGKSGSVINYDPSTQIKSFEDQGYVLKNNGFPAGSVFDSDNSKNQTFYIDFVHGTTTVTPDKPGKPGQPVDPNNPNGPKYPDGTDEKSVKVTGTQTIHYTGAGDNTPKDNVQSYDFTRNITFDNVTGKIINTTPWNETSHTFGSVNTPVVDGYHADKRTAGDTTVTPNDLNKTVTVNYSPNGKIIPVDPKTNKPIPNAPTPTYPTDPSDPTKVTPDEPVPNIPGLTPSVPSVTPKDPGKDTPVPYNTIQGSVQVIFHDDTTNSTIPDVGYNSGSQKAGTKVDYTTTQTIQDLENKGYVYVSTDGTIPAEIAADKNITVTVHMKHGTTTVTPDKPGKPGEPINPNDPNGPKWPDTTGKNNLSKTGTQTIHYTGAGTNTPKDNVQSFTFTRTAVVDNVTGKVISTGSWNETSHTFGNVNTPVVDGYHADKRTAGDTTITPDDLTKTVTVNYTANGKIIPVDPNGKPIPNAPTPQYHTDPNDPTKVVPNEPVPNVPGYTPSVPSVTPSDPGKDTPVPYTPQTTPVTPVTPVQPTTPTTPTKPKTNPEPNKPSEPKKPSVPETPKKPTTPKKHVTPNKPEHRTPAPTPTPAPNRNTTPRPQSNWSNNFAPHGESIGQNNNVAPHGQTVNGWTNNVGPHGEHVDGNGNIVAPNGEIIGYVDQNGNPHYTKLPQTGEDKTNDIASAILGGAAVSIGLIGLAGVKKRRREE